MKIAVPTRDGHIDDHFGHCAYYTIFEVAPTSIYCESHRTAKRIGMETTNSYTHNIAVMI